MNSAMELTDCSTRFGRLFVADRHAEGPLDLQHELERVDRIQSKAFAEQRHIVGDLAWRESAAAGS